MRHELIAIKRRWVPEWLFAIASWPVDLVVHQPIRWLLTEPLKKKPPVTYLAK